MIEAFMLYVLLFVGFLIVAWVVNQVPLLKKKENEGSLADSAMVLVLFSSLFGSYTYLMAHLFHSTF